MRVEHRTFRGVWSSFDELFSQAADFASSIGPERLISISHSEDKNDGVVTVWYWSSTPALHATTDATPPKINLR